MAARALCPDETEETQNDLVQQFLSVTGVDKDVAIFYVQQGGGNIQAALDLYYETVDSTQSVLTQCSGTGQRDNPLLIPDDDDPVVGVVARTETTATENMTSGTATSPLKILSWNIDGLDEQNLHERTRAVCDIINARRPDVVFLQEVIAESLSMLQTRCSSYQCLTSGNLAYFNAMLLHTSTIQPLGSLQCTRFSSSEMGRHLLTQPATFHDAKVVLMTSHLESTGQCVPERKNQFRLVLKKIQEQSRVANVIFGGDTNLRDKEVVSIGGLPRGIVDIWEACGSPPDAKYSWDVGLNDNLDWPSSRNKPKLRFDRLFLQQSHQKALLPEHFEFVGTERLPGCQRFPSDHWGLWTELSITSEQDTGTLTEQ